MLCLIVSIVMIPLQKLPRRRGDGGVRLRSAAGHRLRLYRPHRRPGTAAAFGPDLEAAGAVGGSVVSIAAATFGLVAGSLMGGPTAKRLIEKARPAPETVAVGGTQGVGRH